MPRLSDIDYIRNHLALRNEWVARDANAFAYITPTDQFAIHDYYEPSLELDAIQLITHRRAITAKSPSLPQQAGKAFVRIQPFLDMPPPASRPARKGHRKRDYQIRILSVVNPHIDPEKIAKILVQMMMENQAHPNDGGDSP